MNKIDITNIRTILKFIKSQMKSGVSFENTMKLLGYVRKEYNPPNIDTCVKQNNKTEINYNQRFNELNNRIRKLENRISNLEK